MRVEKWGTRAGRPRCGQRWWHRAGQRWKWPRGSGASRGEAQGLTAVGVVPPAGQGSACLLAGNGVPAEDLAAQLLLVFGVPGDTQIQHTAPGGAAGTVEGEEERGTLSPVA